MTAPVSTAPPWARTITADRLKRLAELRGNAWAVHTERSEQLRAALVQALGAGWEVEVTPVTGPWHVPARTPLEVLGYELRAYSAEEDRWMLSYVMVEAWRPQAPSWQADYFRRMLGKKE